MRLMLIAGILFTSSLASAAMPDLTTLTCDRAKYLVRVNGAINMTSGSNEYVRYVKDASWCYSDENWMEAAFVETLDSDDCFIGWVCMKNPHESLSSSSDDNNNESSIPSDPGPTDPGPTDPGPTDPGPTDPDDGDDGEDPGPVDPGPTDPGPTDPGPTDPDDPGPTDPDDPGPTDPGPTDPDDPGPTDPDDPGPTDPDDPGPVDPDDV